MSQTKYHEIEVNGIFLAGNAGKKVIAIF